jgi:hypothetical protein
MYDMNRQGFFNPATMKAIDRIFETMPYKWEKWEKREKIADDTTKDLCELLEDSQEGFFPA